MASPLFQFWEKKRPTIRTGAAKHFEGLAALSTHSAGRWAAVKAGCKLVHFSLDGCLLFCYFSGSVATLRDILSTSRSVGRGTGAFIYLPPFSENNTIFCAFPFVKFSLFSCRSKRGHKASHPGSTTSHARAGITHYTLRAKSCAKGQAPLKTPDNKTAVCYPCWEHTAVCCQQPVSRSVFALCKVCRVTDYEVFERKE